MSDTKAADFPRCAVCGGRGLGLVTNPQKLCTHCARQTKAFFDPDTNKFCRDEGFVDISPNADGGVLKKILREGNPEGKRIEEGCPTFVQYIGRLDDGSIFDTTRDVVDGKHVGGTDDSFEFQLGREKVIKGWDIGVATMNVGELARFIIAPEYAYGSQGFAPKVEPDETLDFEIELESFKEPLPRFPTQAELAESRKKQAEEERKMYEANPPPSIDERIADALKSKEKGNKLVAEKEYEKAQKKYDSGFVHIFFGKEELEHMPAEDKEKINKVKHVLYLNRSLCKIKLGKIDDAQWDCDQAILLDASNGKGHFRRSLVYIEKIKGELEKEKKGEFWILDKGYEFANEAEKSLNKATELIGGAMDAKMKHASADLKRCQALLAKYTAKYKEAEKKLYKEKIFDRMEAKNRALQHQEKKKALEEEFDDMPALE
uniref:peptidylprolyl isomerase n=1 Tax=Globisporangium ultimum (strain ATCC 200006 / CBS 805.95 / DAOM BR144) TaxID=431595 RepID=K3X0E9_GLOUD